MPMLYDYSGPGAFTPVPVCPSSGPAEGPLIRLESLCHFDAVSTYRVIRDGLPELLFAYTQGGEGRLTYQGVAHTLRRGDAFLVDCRDWHRYETAGEHWDFLWMHLSGELAFSFARYIWERRGPVVSGGPAFAAGWQAVLELVRHNDPRAEAAVSAAVLVAVASMRPMRDLAKGDRPSMSDSARISALASLRMVSAGFFRTSGISFPSLVLKGLTPILSNMAILPSSEWMACSA